jgi:hypothetical protein
LWICAVADKRNVRVFVTYAVDTKQHRVNVVRLCDCLKKNNFSVSLDARETHLLKDGGEVAQWHDTRYNVVGLHGQLSFACPFRVALNSVSFVVLWSVMH